MDFNDNNMNSTGGWSRNPGYNMAMAAMFLGIAAVFSMLTVYLPIIFGALAIIFALLSKGYGKKLMATAKVGITAGIGSLVVILSVFASVFSFLINCTGDELINMGKQADQYYEKQTGVSIDSMFGKSYEDIMKSYVELLGK